MNSNRVSVRGTTRFPYERPMADAAPLRTGAAVAISSSESRGSNRVLSSTTPRRSTSAMVIETWCGSADSCDMRFDGLLNPVQQHMRRPWPTGCGLVRSVQSLALADGRSESSGEKPSPIASHDQVESAGEQGECPHRTGTVPSRAPTSVAAIQGRGPSRIAAPQGRDAARRYFRSPASGLHLQNRARGTRDQCEDQ